MEPLKVKDIDFSTPQSKTNVLNVSTNAPQRVIAQKSNDEFCNILHQLEGVGCFSAVMNVVPPFNRNVPPHNLSLKGLFKEQYVGVPVRDLQNIASNFNFTYTEQDIKDIEILARAQSKRSEWFTYRAGRITASNRKSVCSTRIDAPAISSIKKKLLSYENTIHKQGYCLGLFS